MMKSKVLLVFNSLSCQILLAYACFYLVHRLFVFVFGIGDADFGVLQSYHILPLYARWDMRMSHWAWPALIVLGLFVFFSRRLYLSGCLRPWKLLAVSWVLFMAIGLTVSSIDNTVHQGGDLNLAFLESYRRAPLEYFGALPLVEDEGVRAFVRRFSVSGGLDDLPIHVQTHPPGGVIFLWWVRQLFGPSLLAAALATIAFTGAALGGIWMLAKVLYGEEVARQSLALYLLVPSVVLYTTTSMDGPFAVLPVYSVAFFYFGFTTRRWIWTILSGIFLALALFMTYAATFLGLFYAIVTLMALWKDRNRWPWLLRQMLVLGFAMLGMFVLLWIMVGFNPMRAVLNSIKADHRIMGSLPMTPKRWLTHGAAHLTAFLFGMGVPVTVLWLRSLRGSLRALRKGEPMDIFQAGFAFSLLAIAFSTLYTLEVERIWMFMSPWVVIPAALHLRDMNAQHDQPWNWWVVLAFLAFQVFAYEFCFCTYW